MKKYEVPEIEILTIATENVLTDPSGWMGDDTDNSTGWH